jgi:predicted XRE-type DNA-binding protein
MDMQKRKALEAAGFRFGDAADFLELTEEERMLVELRVKLAQAIRRRRELSDLSQKQVAARIKSSQPRVAKIEAAAPDVSLDQMFRGLFAVGGKVEDLVTPLPAGQTVRRKGKKWRKGKKSGPPVGV